MGKTGGTNEGKISGGSHFFGCALPGESPVHYWPWVDLKVARPIRNTTTLETSIPRVKQVTA